MDYDRKNANVEFYLFRGDVEVNIFSKNNDSFTNTLNSAGNEMFSLFTSFIPYGNVIGSAKNIFSLINSAIEPALTSAGQAMLRGHWSRIEPDGNGEIGWPIDNPVCSDLIDWGIYKTGISVNVGEYFSVYRDISTRFQQRSEGYIDLWGLINPPKRYAEIKVKPYQTVQQPYYKIKRN